MTQVSIEIKGLDRFRKALARYPRIARRHFAEAVAKSTRKAEGTIKKRTPVKSGLLRGTIGSAHSALEGKVVPVQRYAIFVHEGTRFQRSQPFLVEGLEDAKDDIERYFEEGLNKTLREISNV